MACTLKSIPKYQSMDLQENAALKKYIAVLESKLTCMEADTSFLSQKNISLAAEILNQKNRIVSLENILIDFKRNRFGTKSEKFDAKDSYFQFLFNEAEIGIQDEEKLYDGHEETIHVKSFPRKKAGRKLLPAHFTREEIIHDIPESEKTCNCGHKLCKIDEVISEKLAIKPATVYVEKHIRYKYVCKNCEGDERDEVGKIVVLAPIENQLLPKSIVTAELLTHVLISKFLDHIPFYRMENIFLRYKLEITRATLCNWTIGVYEKYFHLFDFFKDHLLSGRLLGIDETVLQVHREEGRSDTSTSYMWVIRGGTVDKPILWYQYRPTRSADFLKEYLSEYKGIIQTDGFSSYDSHFKHNENILHAGCMAHARREFEKQWKTNKNPVAGKILSHIRELYKIEDTMRLKNLFHDKKFSEIVTIRQEKAKPILDSLHIYLQELLLSSHNTLAIGKAIRYTLNQWDKLILYLSYGEVYIDNNLVENAIRPFVLGRKNWLFAGSPKGASASAFWYSLIQTAKANNKDPNNFLLQFLKGLPAAKTKEDIAKLFKDSMGWG